MGTFAENLKKQFELLQREEMYFVKDLKIIEYFAGNPDNNKKEDIITKISTINHKEINDLLATEKMAEHILALGIDRKLQANDLSVVEEIANITINGQKHRLMNFASMYCNYHKPDIYPIYSDQHLDYIKEYVNEFMPDTDVSKLDNYIIRKSVMDDIINRTLGDKKVNYFEARKFGWLYLDQFIKQFHELRMKSN